MPPRTIITLALTLALWSGTLANAFATEAAPRPAPAAVEPKPSARSRYENARFGVSFRWGVYALLGKGEAVMEAERLPISEYEKLPPRFHPRRFDAEAWADAARAAGARYVDVMAKGPDGFCMFDSSWTSFDVVDATPFGRDPLAALASACHDRGIALVFTYSMLDWHHPDYFPRGVSGKSAGRPGEGDWKGYGAYVRGQIRELCTNYGEVAGLRLEGLADRPDGDWDLAETCRLVRELQPGAAIVLDERGPAGLADVRTFARELPRRDTLGDGTLDGRAAEIWLPLNQSCGFQARDKAFKSPEQLIRALALAAGEGANLLVGVGPGPDGSIGDESAGRLAEVGRWLRPRGEAFFGARRGPIAPQSWGVSTRKGGIITLHVLDATGPIRLPDTLGINEAALGGAIVPLQPDGEDLLLEIPEALRVPIDTIVTLRPAGEGR